MIIKDRKFIQAAKQALLDTFQDEKVAGMFEKCMENTLDTTIKIQDGETFILTGDIPAMWLRDSVCQVRPFLLFAKDHAEIQEMLLGLIKKQVKLIAMDPYANAFNESANGAGHQNDKTEMSPAVWERKYEIDSLCYPVQLAYLIWKITGRTEHFTTEFKQCIDTIVTLWKVEQHHEEKSPYLFEREDCVPTDTLVRKGKGSLTGYTGMTWSGFRPSDDACTYGYLVPSNMFAAVVLKYAEEMLSAFYSEELALLERVRELRTQIEEGIEKHAIVTDDCYGEMYAYEVDGLGHTLQMDDANVPSLMALPFLNYCDPQDARYQNTRRFILSSKNSTFFKGREANGVGSPHTPNNYVWPIALSIQGLTSQFESEKRDIVATLLRTDAGTGLMHESFNVNNANEYTREWFSWANMMFCELVLDVAGINMHKFIR
ncbi:glycoside hydrolase family 125 protein [Paenibacillus guangzhouensis]|uniref:glycoside hydrolase family 125 protein n=1 Tax=Paenibacillus guangzhouensis TaxID=1473112 RepID=UPI001267678A|nr:glycoside hydrolase family 125 protein [Paenibacillus guangzhouensis]